MAQGNQRVVTFNEGAQTPAQEAQMKTARLMAGGLGFLLGVCVLIPLTIAVFYFNLALASDLAESAGEMLFFGVIAVAITACVPGGALAAAILSVGYPLFAKAAGGIAGVALVLSMIAGLLFAASVQTPAQRSASATGQQRAAYLDAQLRTLETPTERAAWDATSECKAKSIPAEWGPTCIVIKDRRAKQLRELQSIRDGKWTGEWTPGAVFGESRFGAAPRRVLITFLGAAIPVAYAILSVVLALSIVEIYRLAEGGPVPEVLQPAQTRAAPGAPQVFDDWFDVSVGFHPAAELESKKALGNFREVFPSQQLVTDQRFFKLLAERSRESGGSALPGKAKGNMRYRGMYLLNEPADPMIPIDAEFDEIKVLPHRKGA